MPGACAGGSDRPSRQGEQSVEPMWTGLSVRRLAFMLLEAGVNVLKLAGYSGTSHVAHEVDEDGGHEGRTRTHPPIIRPEASHQPTPATLRAHHMRDSGTEAGAGRLLVSAGCFLGWQRARSSMIMKLGVTPWRFCLPPHAPPRMQPIRGSSNGQSRSKPVRRDSRPGACGRRCQRQKPRRVTVR